MVRLKESLWMARGVVGVTLCFVGTAAFSQAHTAGEVRVQQALDAAKKAGPGELHALLVAMPKGADLHMHLSGAVYAETFIAEAAKEGLCVGPVDAGRPPVPEGQNALDLVALVKGRCPAGTSPASDAMKNQSLYDAMVDSFSMRAFVPTQGIDGHDQFFSTFDRVGALHGEAGQWLDEVVTRAAAQNEQYLEIMQTPPFSHAAALGYQLGWPAGSEASVSFATLAKLREALLSGGLRDEVATDEQSFAEAKAERRRLEGCDAPVNGMPSRACNVKVHWLYQVLRGFPPQQVFAQTTLAFEVANADPDVVGLNFVMPEDGRLSMQDYHLQMQMLDYLHSVYPKVHVTLHAGELAPGMVPPSGLQFHIREAIDLGHAERIGHGVDLLYEDKPEALLKEMAEKHVAVEINLTSNAVILGIEGKEHPLAAYRAAHVPFSLCTDDEGVSRIDLTHEYVRAVEEQGLNYADLKTSARASLEHSFMHGADLWESEDHYAKRNAVCGVAIGPDSKPSSGCQAFLNANEKAAAQWELERRFAAFEAHVPAVTH
jgi:adenosine deaminase